MNTNMVLDAPIELLLRMIITSPHLKLLKAKSFLVVIESAKESIKLIGEEDTLAIVKSSNIIFFERDDCDKLPNSESYVEDLRLLVETAKQFQQPFLFDIPVNFEREVFRIVCAALSCDSEDITNLGTDAEYFSNTILSSTNCEKMLIFVTKTTLSTPFIFTVLDYDFNLLRRLLRKRRQLCLLLAQSVTKCQGKLMASIDEAAIGKLDPDDHYVLCEMILRCNQQLVIIIDDLQKLKDGNEDFASFDFERMTHMITLSVELKSFQNQLLSRLLTLQ